MSENIAQSASETPPESKQSSLADHLNSIDAAMKPLIEGIVSKTSGGTQDELLGCLILVRDQIGATFAAMGGMKAKEPSNDARWAHMEGYLQGAIAGIQLMHSLAQGKRDSE